MLDYFRCWLDSEALVFGSVLITRSRSWSRCLRMHRTRCIDAIVRSACILHPCTRSACTRIVASSCIVLDACVQIVASAFARSSCILLDARSFAVHACCSMQCNARDRSPCMQAARCSALESLRGHALESLRGHAREVVGTIWNRSSNSRC